MSVQPTSWDEYINGSVMIDLDNGHRLHSAILIGKDGQIWGKSDTCPGITVGQARSLAHCLEGADGLRIMTYNGIFIDEEKYFIMEGSAAGLRAKSENMSLFLQETDKGALVALYDGADDNQRARTIEQHVKFHTDHLKKQGV